MRVMSWNLNGIISCVQHNSFQALSPFVPDVVCCQEIRTKQQPQALPGYHHFWNPGQRDDYSGTLTMTRQSPLSIIYGLGDENLDSEGRVLAVEFPDIYIVNAYSPNSQKNLSRRQFRSRWDDAFRTFIFLSYPPCLVTGTCADGQEGVEGVIGRRHRFRWRVVPGGW